MEFRKMLTITLYARQQKRHRSVEQSFGLCGRGRRWDDFGRMALKHVYYHMWNGLPVQVRCMRQGARGWCTGMTQRDGMGREVGGGFRMGNTCTPVVDSCQCMAKLLQYCKVISLQLNKFILKKYYPQTQCSEMLANVHKCKRVMMCFTEKICVR